MTSGWICLTLSWILLCGVSCYDNATELTDHLLANYNTGVRPYCNNGETTNITLDIAIRQVIDLDEPNQVLKISAWIRLVWTDCRLVWNISDYGNVTNIHVPYKQIWIPDLAPYDSVATEFVGIRDFRANIYSDGTVHYNFPTILETLCPVNVQKFPFDTQCCALQLGSWSYNGIEIDMFYKAPTGDLSASKDNVEWDLLSFTAVKSIHYYACCPEPYPDLTYTLVLKRKPSFYITNILTPSAVICSIALLGFILPVDSGEKVSLQITVMLSLAVFQLMVADKLPPDSDVTPYISIYFNFGLIIVGVACTFAVMVDYVHFKGSQPLPRWMRVLFLKYLAYVTCIYVPDESKNSLMQSESKSTENGAFNNNHDVDLNGFVIGGITTGVHDGNGSLSELKAPSSISACDEESLRSEEWKIVAAVIDRICFVLFLILVFGGHCVILAYMIN